MRSFKSEDVTATGIARSVNKESRADVNWRDVIQIASTLGIAPHPNQWGSTCYTAHQASCIREEMIKKVEIDRQKTEIQDPPMSLNAFTDKQLADELRRRGWELSAERKIVETL